MSKLCRQLSIESPGPALRECVFNFDVPVPDVPMYGARIRVAYAGACYRANRTRSASVCSASSVSSVGSLSGETENMGVCASMPAHVGLRDGALFPGYEVAGVIDAIGKNADCEGFKVGDRIVLFPYEGVPHGYAEYIVVPDLKCLVAVPANVPLSVAAMLPTGALLAMNTIRAAKVVLTATLRGPERKEFATALIVGTGGLALWALRIASWAIACDPLCRGRVRITVAALKDDGLPLAPSPDIRVVQWSEDLYERQLIERTTDACGGPVDVVVNFGTTSRALHRSLQCIAPDGVVLITEDVGEKLLPKFAKKADEMGVEIMAVPNGTIDELRELIACIASHQIEPPPYVVFPVEEAPEVIRKLCKSEVKGRAIFQFHDVE